MENRRLELLLVLTFSLGLCRLGSAADLEVTFVEGPMVYLKVKLIEPILCRKQIICQKDHDVCGKHH
jgi:hypothetical protein